MADALLALAEDGGRGRAAPEVTRGLVGDVLIERLCPSDFAGGDAYLGLRGAGEGLAVAAAAAAAAAGPAAGSGSGSGSGSAGSAGAASIAASAPASAGPVSAAVELCEAYVPANTCSGGLGREGVGLWAADHYLE